MNFNYSKVQELSDEDLSNIMFMILIGTNVVQKGRKFQNIGEDPRTISAYQSILEDITNQIPKGLERPVSNLMEFINLEIQFEAEKRDKMKQSYFTEINIQTRVDGLFNTTRQADINEEIYF